MLIHKLKMQGEPDILAGWIPTDKIGKNLWTDKLDVIEEPAVFFQSDGTVFHTNPAALSFYGVEEADLLGMHCYEMVRRFGLRFSECPYQKMLNGGEPESGMVEYDGVWYAHRAEPVLGDNGEIHGMISTIQDGDERFRLHAVSEQLNCLLAATDNSVLIVGVDQRIVRWNHAVGRIFGHDVNYLKGRLIYDLVPIAFRKTFAAFVDRVMKGETISEFSIPAIAKSGDVIDVSVSMAPLHDPAGTVSGMILLSRDVSGERAVDMRLVQHLSDTSVRINGPLSHMRTNLEETVAALQDGLLTTEELVIFLTLLMKSVGHIEEGLREMNNVAIDGIESIPEEFRKYLAR